MKTICLVCFVFATCFLGVTGCKKSQPPQPEGTIQQSGVTLELPKLDTEFKNASPEVQAVVERIKSQYARGQLTGMLRDLQGLSTNPSLTEPQKTLVANLINEMNQVISGRAAGQ